jgi:hypothetical protein
VILITNSEVKNELRFALTSLYAFMALCFVRDSFNILIITSVAQKLTSGGNEGMDGTYCEHVEMRNA